MQFLVLNLTTPNSSHNLLILNRLVVSPSTSITSFKGGKPTILTILLPKMQAFLPSPKVTDPLTFISTKDSNQFLSPVICLEQPLSKYHLSLRHALRAVNATIQTTLVSSMLEVIAKEHSKFS